MVTNVVSQIQSATSKSGVAAATLSTLTGHMPWYAAVGAIVILTGPEYLRLYLAHVEVMAKTKK